MRLVSWNVNSVRQRLPRLLAFLERHDPDVVALQETKVTDDVFPREALEDAGYVVTPFGQKTYNGVAFVSKSEPEDVTRGFPGDPVADQARVMSGVFDGVRVVDVYVVNGKSVDDPSFDTKLAWLEALRVWLEGLAAPSEPLVVMGDFNIAPSDLDSYDPVKWRDKIFHSVPEREALGRFLGWGLTDLHRAHTDEQVFTWWDYRHGAFPRDWGLRIDLALGTRPVVDRLVSVAVDREERKKSSGEGNPSDHAPLIVDLG